MTDVKAPAETNKSKTDDVPKGATILSVAKDMDKVKKAMLKAEGALNATQKQINAMEARKKDALGDIAELEEQMENLQTAMQNLIND